MSYVAPTRRILAKEQMEAFQASKTHQDLISYIEALNDAVIDVRLTDDCTMSDGVKAALDIIDKVEELAKSTPPLDNEGSRFGNPAFCTLYDRIAENSSELHESLPRLPLEAIPEVSVYFQEAWGSRARIDYGSGMELNFLCWLLCMQRLGVFEDSDYKALVIRVFWRYIQVMRILQSTYWLEPAGSHGVWGLDDYHFLPFLFGSAQLRGHKYLRPKSIHDNEVIEEYSKDYMYLACIQFINSIKTATLRWHSPMLDDISGVKTWEKVDSGMFRMYRAEVLGKLPVVQHFLFGSILSYDGPELSLVVKDSSDGVVGHADLGHVHGQGDGGWGDCCGIAVPSAFGAAMAAAEDRRSGGFGSIGGLLEGPGIRPVPFD